MKKDRLQRHFRSLRVPLLLLIWAAVSLGCAPSPPRSIVLVTIDTLRADHLGAYGYPRELTPFLDSLAARGVLFEDASASAALTAPSHATMLTGQSPHAHRVVINGVNLDPGVPTLPAHLSRHGWETAAFVSVRFLKGLARGFEHFEAPTTRRGLPGDDVKVGADPGEAPAYRAGEYTVARVAEWLQQRRNDRPLFLWVHLYDVHETEPRVPVQPKFLRQSRRSWRRHRADLYDFYQEQFGLDLAADRSGLGRVENRIKRYDAQLAYADAQVRRLYEAVQGALPPKQTLWIITSDHGEGLGEHGYLGHGRYLFREQLHVPLIFHRRGRALPSRRVETPVRLLDLAPTVAELAGAPLPQRWPNSGRSLEPWLRGRAEPRRERPNLALRPPPNSERLRSGWRRGYFVSLRRGPWKYIHTDYGADWLFNLKTDPHEKHNLVRQDLSHGDQLAARTKRLREAFESFGLNQRPQYMPEFASELKALGYL